MNINGLLKEKYIKISTSQKSCVPQTTIIDICSNKQKKPKKVSD